MSQESAIALVPTKSDRDVANDLHRRFRQALVPVRDLVDEALQTKFNVNFVFGRDPYGKLTLETKLTRDFPEERE